MPDSSTVAPRHIFEYPFSEHETLPPIVRLELESSAGSRVYDSYELHHVEEAHLLALAREALGEPLDDVDRDLLAQPSDLVLDWGDEVEAEGLYMHELRGIKQTSPHRWELADGRGIYFVVEHFATLPMTVAPEPQAS